MRLRLGLHMVTHTGARQGDALQVRLTAGATRAHFVTTHRDPLAAFDRAEGEVAFPRGLVGDALRCESERAVVAAARATLSPGGDSSLERAEVDAVASLLGQDCGSDDMPVKGQHNPVHTAHFWSWLDQRTARGPGDFVRGAWSASASQTPANAETWLHEPDLLDVARKTLRAPGYGWSELGPALLDYESDASRLGVRGQRDWDLSWEGKTRRLYAPGELTPYVVSRMAIAHPPARLRVEWEWEQHAHFTMLAVGLHEDGSVERRVWVHSPLREYNVSYTFGGLEHVSELVLLATNTGDPDRPYDADEGPAEPHRLSITYADANAL